MDTQHLLVLVIIAITSLWIVQSTWRTWFGASKTGCGSACGGCAASKAEEKSVKGRIPLKQV